MALAAPTRGAKASTAATQTLFTIADMLQLLMLQ
jgi:hypothetical protein